MEKFSRSIENRRLSIEDQVTGTRDWNAKKISNSTSDSGFCLDFLKNRVADLEFQVTEKDAIISFVLK